MNERSKVEDAGDGVRGEGEGRPGTAAAEATDWRRVWDGLGDALGGKWAFHVLRALDEGDAGFNELRPSATSPRKRSRRGSGSSAVGGS